MNDKYAIDPAATEGLKDVAALFRIFGASEGRFILDFPCGWVHLVKDYLQDRSPIEQMKTVETWIRLKQHAILPTKAPFRRDWTWPENSVAIKNSVQAVIGKRGCAPTQRPIDDALEDPTEFPDARGGLIPRTPEAYAKAAEPLLLTSPKIVLVDPYFRLRERDDRRGGYRPSARHVGSTKALLATAAAGNRVERFVFAVSRDQAFDGDPDETVFCEDLEKIADAAGATRIELEYRLLDPAHSTDRHPRYLLGLCSGLHFDWGFDTQDSRTTNHIEWIGNAALEPLLRRFT